MYLPAIYLQKNKPSENKRNFADHSMPENSVGNTEENESKEWRSNAGFG